MDDEKSGSVQNVGGSKSRTIGAYNESAAGDYRELSKQLGIPLSVLIGWRRNDEKGAGWLSCPVTKEEYETLVILSGRLWCNPFLMRMQMSRLTAAKQEFVVRGAGLTWVESVVIEDLLRCNLLKENHTIKFPWYQQWFQTRYPKGYQQLTLDLFQKMANRVSEIIKSAIKNGKHQLLVDSLCLEYGEHIVTMQECQNKPNHNFKMQNEPSGHLVDKVELDEAEAKMRDEEWFRQFGYSPKIHWLNLEHKLRELNENKKKNDDDKDDSEKK